MGTSLLIVVLSALGGASVVVLGADLVLRIFFADALRSGQKHQITTYHDKVLAVWVKALDSPDNANKDFRPKSLEPVLAPTGQVQANRHGNSSPSFVDEKKQGALHGAVSGFAR